METLTAQLEHISGDSRTRVAFITYDSAVHFYNLKASLAQPQMLVVSDLEDLFLPSPEDLLVNLNESRDIINQLLASLPRMFPGTGDVSSCLGAALLLTKELLGNLGGRVTIFQTALPNLGEGALKNREDISLRGTPKELQQLAPSTDFYKQFSVDASRAQIGIDLFLFNSEFIDVSTLVQTVKFAAGMVYRYAHFNSTTNPGLDRTLHSYPKILCVCCV